MGAGTVRMGGGSRGAGQGGTGELGRVCGAVVAGSVVAERAWTCTCGGDGTGPDEGERSRNSGGASLELPGSAAPAGLPGCGWRLVHRRSCYRGMESHELCVREGVSTPHSIRRRFAGLRQMTRAVCGRTGLLTGTWSGVARGGNGRPRQAVLDGPGGQKRACCVACR